MQFMSLFKAIYNTAFNTKQHILNLYDKHSIVLIFSVKEINVNKTTVWCIPTSASYLLITSQAAVVTIYTSVSLHV